MPTSYEGSFWKLRSANDKKDSTERRFNVKNRHVKGRSVSAPGLERVNSSAVFLVAAGWGACAVQQAARERIRTGSRGAEVLRVQSTSYQLKKMMSLLCALGGHEAGPDEVYNGGYYYSR